LRTLKNLLQENKILLVPGAYDALTAKLIDHVGFPAVYMTGAGVSYSQLGMPDIGLLTLTEMAAQAEQIVDAVHIPVIADADNGFGNALNVRRMVKAYEKAGVAALQMEDQAFPKKCGHMNHKTLISTDEMVGKIKAAVDARTDDQLQIIARTDARGVLGLQEAVERAKRYEEAGADILFIEAPQSIEELNFIASQFSIPLMANMVEGGKTPVIPATELGDMGYKLVIYPNTITRFYIKQVLRILNVLKESGSSKGYSQEMMLFNEINQILGLNDIQELEERYAPSILET
jgi:2,3-dimethylmalate lyase